MDTMAMIKAIYKVGILPYFKIAGVKKHAKEAVGRWLEDNMLLYKETLLAGQSYRYSIKL